MPPKKKPIGGGKGKRAPVKRKMPPPMSPGELLTDFSKKTSWVLGQSIGTGGFGEIYSASNSEAKSTENYVVKIVGSFNMCT